MRLEYFQMLDEIVEAANAERPVLTARAFVPERSPVFEGHFPGYAILPGVLMLETMAQASGYLLLTLNGFSRMIFFANAKEANFRSFVRPGSTLEVKAELVHEGSGYAVTQATITQDAKRIADAKLTMRSVPFSSPALQAHVMSEGRRLGLVAAETG
ncbi:beta-hydroxyacyl-(acyl-carrier-protein) dehydratase FabA/FabZ [Hyphomicrobium denitrificans 1NES1]|uniref:Beta-hydroxyacyl-(Acyl-carrier-protein) dehydratase FabA/FabZ n=1 Tax=Hyphomicrobium denitrificans 1NES1 TaxID=670307 RepID=N0B1C3_9HYPH|nr:3-hydroxyacyl-ACP dehydratase FabZ family protein [Hyphomicrobium denitrificans]AGK56758.1 beta-hydroxyacyl-(acyl-carrier-protein) dehydratase FabA/FabZ [Hyphomicrobium denitrificans 1NES1]